ncbi:MAG TPA: glycosyltransferase [Actinomycetota bacterium]|nr:glycosyltransferase [Actinomycetota bacterium]
MLPTVPLADKHVDEYAAPAGEEAVERLRKAAKPFAGATMLHLNSTAYGGGVAELLQSQLPLLNDLGIQATWALLEGSDDYYADTKSVHNALQGAEVPWTEEMRSAYWDRIRANAAEFTDGYDYVFVHDPQPAALLTVLEEEGLRSGRWVWRCHIDLSTPFRPVWEFFEPIVNRYDAAIFTMEDFAQPGVTDPELAFIPPSIDPCSTKNLDLAEETITNVLHTYGIDPNRPIVMQVSRFDPWKDPLGVIDAFRLARKTFPDLQLILAGSMAHDDPEGMRFLDLTEEHRAGDPDIHLLTNVHNVGNLEINAFQRASTVVIQKSIREGFGLVVAEGMWKDKPVIGGNVGGIRLQITDGQTGFLVDSVEGCAERIVQLLENPELQRTIGRAARERVRDRFLTLRELEDYLGLMTSLR